MVMEVIAGLIIFAFATGAGNIIFGFLGGAVGALSGKDKELAVSFGIWIGVAMFWALALIFALVVAL